MDECGTSQNTVSKMLLIGPYISRVWRGLRNKKWWIWCLLLILITLILLTYIMSVFSPNNSDILHEASIEFLSENEKFPGTGLLLNWSIGEDYECGHEMDKFINQSGWATTLTSVNKISGFSPAEMERVKVFSIQKRIGLGENHNSSCIELGKGFCSSFESFCSNVVPDLRNNVVKNAHVILEMGCAAHTVRFMKERPGTTFTSSTKLKDQFHISDMKADKAVERVVRYSVSASAISQHPNELARFLIASLPDFVYLYIHLPSSVPIAIPSDIGIGRSFFDFFLDRGVFIPERVIPFNDTEVIIADRLYTLKTVEMLEKHDASLLYRFNHLFPPLKVARDWFLDRLSGYLSHSRSYILVICNRGKMALTNEEELLFALKERFKGTYTVETYIGGAQSLIPADLIPLFMNARAVVGLHGEELANMIFCQKGTAFVEIAYDDVTDGIWPGGLYYSGIVSLGLDYGASVGAGKRGSNVTCNVGDVVDVLERLIL